MAEKASTLNLKVHIKLPHSLILTFEIEQTLQSENIYYISGGFITFPCTDIILGLPHHSLRFISL